MGCDYSPYDHETPEQTTQRRKAQERIRDIKGGEFDALKRRVAALEEKLARVMEHNRLGEGT